jgi:hypothetical protein
MFVYWLNVIKVMAPAVEVQLVERVFTGIGGGNKIF